MSSAESQQQGGQSHLQKQDLATLDITKLTPQSPQVISRQATINIGTIGHVAHGKSTVVKAISSVHTVRFKNELERNITIKLDNGKTLMTRNLSPMVRMSKLSQQEINDLTKSHNRQKNLKAYMKNIRLSRRNSMDKSRKQRREELDTDARKKIKVILEEFLECRSNNVDMLQNEIAIFKPKHIKLADIDRDCNFSETSSISGRDSLGKSSRPRRASIAPERFVFTPEPSPKPKLQKKPLYVDPDASYEVEAICDINLIKNQIFVQVKWENYTTKDNTWEPLENVKETEALEQFLEYEMTGEEEKINAACQQLLDEDQQDLEAFSRKPKRAIMQELKNFDPLEFKCYQLIYMLIKDQENFYYNFRKKFRHMLILNHFHELDIKQHEEHKRVKTDIMEKEMKVFSVTIVNDVDFTTFEYFHYVRENILPADYDDLNRSVKLGCNCENGCSRESNCCPSIVKGQFAYKNVNNKKRLRLNNTQMIYECNENCSCDVNCLNRVTQQPRLFPMQIFKTDDDRGWGLKTTSNIPSGTFLMEYTGEIIDQQESNLRGEKYDEIGLSYLFDLDFNDEADAVYTIDAFKSGNLSRLINHSCEPNCRIWPVMTANQDPQIYKLCYFSVRLIKAGEELTFDYSGGVPIEPTNNDADDESGGVAGNNIVRRYRTVDSCKCGSENCRGFIFN